MSDSDGLASSARCTLFDWPGSTAIAFIDLSALLNEFRDERGPAGLLARADRAAAVAVEVFGELHEVVSVRVCLEQLVAAEHRPPAVRVVEEDPHQPARQFRGDF